MKTGILAMIIQRKQIRGGTPVGLSNRLLCAKKQQQFKKIKWLTPAQAKKNLKQANNILKRSNLNPAQQEFNLIKKADALMNLDRFEEAYKVVDELKKLLPDSVIPVWTEFRIASVNSFSIQKDMALLKQGKGNAEMQHNLMEKTGRQEELMEALLNHPKKDLLTKAQIQFLTGLSDVIQQSGGITTQILAKDGLFRA